MKKYIIPAATLILISVLKVNAQVENPAAATSNAATNVTNSNIDNGANSGVNKVENGIKGLFKKKNKNQNNNSTPQPAPTNTNPPANPTPSPAVAETGTLKSYANYDFVPGDKIIFQSQLVDEQTGEIPSQFDLSHGQMDIQVEDGENVIHVPKGEGATFTARMKNQTYMPDQFTVEFDFKNELFGVGHLMVDFGSRVYYAAIEGVMPGLTFGTDNSLSWTLGDVTYPEGLDVNFNHPMQWHHIAIAINKTAGKVYVDQFRVVSVNNLTGKANNVTIDVNGYENSYIKNIRIAAGGIDIYKKITTDSKIVTHGILFDIDKATIKPESMGTINNIYNLLKKDPSLKFEIDGHTDNTGEASHNLTLSQQRADAVKTQLVSMGIDASRLSTKGFGDTKPMDTNDTPEGKANNRRVEFIKN
jgi:outer membrane protein OmpA-like peptidoglycan-associated protein